MGGKGALNYLPIVPKASIYVPNVLRKPVMGSNTMCLRLSRTCFSSKVCNALNYLPTVPKASIYVPNVLPKPVMGGNTVSETFTPMFLSQSAWSFNIWPRQSIWRVMAVYGREGCVELSSHCAQSLHICPPKVIFKPVIMGGNTMSETFTPMFLSWSVWSFKIWPRQSIWSVMAEYGREGCVELSSHCAQSLHIYPKGNVQTSYGW